MPRKIGKLAGALLTGASLLMALPTQAASHDNYNDNDRDNDNGNGLVIIHTGDFHGHLIPRANVRSDAVHRRGGYGGLARVATVIDRIRNRGSNVLLMNTGDTIQGGAEVLFTRGQAIVDILNMPEFGFDAFAPGNWDYVYGTDRFRELFAGAAPRAPWGAVAANVFNTTGGPVCANRKGTRVLPAYKIKMMGKLKVGILGLTTDRGPQVVGSAVMKGMCFLKNGDDVFTTDPVTGVTTQTAGGVDSEVAEQVAHLRNVEHVDVLVMGSEMGLANNIRLAEKIDGIDAILSSDMHEVTGRAVVAVNKTTGRHTVVVEEGQDGTMVGKLKIQVEGGRIKGWNWRQIPIDESIPENPRVAAKIAQIRAGFTGPNFANNVNPFNGSHLKRPIDTVVGSTAVPLYRRNFSNENMPAVIEGSSHDFLTDAFKTMTGAQVAAIRGFRYGTDVPVGPIKYEDLFHFMPIGAQIAKANLKGQAIKNQIETAADGSLNPDTTKWTGGWLFNFSGLTMDLDPYVPLTTAAPYPLSVGRAFNIKINGADLALASSYSYASYWYKADGCKINTVDVPSCVVNSTTGLPSNITILKDRDGSPLDGTEVVVQYLQSLSGPANPMLNRISLKDKTTGLPTRLPAAKFGNQEIQPLRGAQP